MNVFRVPLNLIVVVALLKVNSIPYYVSFYVCGALVGLSYVAICYLTDTTESYATVEMTDKEDAWIQAIKKQIDNLIKIIK